MLAWNCSPDDDDEPAATNSTSTSTPTNSTPAEPALSADGITFALAEDSGDDNDKITTNANLVIEGEIPDDAELSFVVMTNDTNHSNDVSTTGTNTFGLAAPTSGTLSVSVKAQLTKDDETAEGTAFEYTLFPWPSEVEVAYDDNGTNTSDGITTKSELTVAGFVVSGLDIKLSAYQITNTSTTMLENTVEIDEDDQLSLSSGYRINMRDVKPSLDANEKIHSITFDYNGHSVDYTFDPGLDYSLFAAFAREFTVATSPDGIAVTANNILLVVSTNTDKVHFYDTNGDNDQTIGSHTSNFGSRGIAGTNQFNNPRDVAVGDGKIYVADNGNDRVQIYNDDFSYSTNITGIRLPRMLSLHEGYLYVTEGLNPNSIIKTYEASDLTNQGSNIATSGKSLVAVAVDSNDVHHVLNNNDDRVEAWTGSPTAGFTARGHHYSMRPGNGNDTTSELLDVVVGPTTGRLYVSDIRREQVVVLEYDGDATSNQYTLIGVLGNADYTSGSGDGEFNNPLRMLIHDGELYIIDQNNNRVQVFDVPE